MYSANEYAPVLHQGVVSFGGSAAEAIGAMSGTQVQLHDLPSDHTQLVHEGLTVFCHFFGSIQGIFLLSVSDDTAHQILELGHDAESVTQVNEFFKEVLNIASGDTLEYLESHFGQLTYFPAVTTRGCSTFPSFASSHVDIRVPGGSPIQCCIFLNLAEVKIGAELKRVQQSLDETEKSARVDSLTGVYNRRFFEKTYDTLVDEAIAEGNDLSLLWIDIDLFKNFNDNYGHQVGDDTLRLLGQAISGSTRDSDLAFRYGGDEFVILLQGSSMEQALMVSDRINTYLRNHPIQCTKTGECTPIQLVVTLSIGIASLHSGDTSKTILKRADDMLYQAKERGRNCVVTELESNS